jgi:hypothetical protein
MGLATRIEKGRITSKSWRIIAVILLPKTMWTSAIKPYGKREHKKSPTKNGRALLLGEI